MVSLEFAYWISVVFGLFFFSKGVIINGLHAKCNFGVKLQRRFSVFDAAFVNYGVKLHSPSTKHFDCMLNELWSGSSQRNLKKNHFYIIFCFVQILWLLLFHKLMIFLFSANSSESQKERKHFVWLFVFLFNEFLIAVIRVFQQALLSIFLLHIHMALVQQWFVAMVCCRCDVCTSTSSN